MIDEILAYNKQFVEKKGYEEYILPINILIKK